MYFSALFNHYHYEAEAITPIIEIESEVGFD